MQHYSDKKCSKRQEEYLILYKTSILMLYRHSIASANITDLCYILLMIRFKPGRALARKIYEKNNYTDPPH